MSKRIIIDANYPNETRVVLLKQNNNIEDIEYETAAKQQNKGNIYLAKITRVEPSLQAAFIDYGTDKSGFLPFSEVHPDYYHIPISDQNHSISNLQQMVRPNITADDLKESAPIVNQYNALIDNDEIDFNVIERLIDESSLSELNLDVLDNHIETISNDKKENQLHKQYKIQEVIKKGQILLVQITKEERGNKGASFSTYISLAGKYCVLMPNTPDQSGVSRKISNSDERKRLKNIISTIISNNVKTTSSIIARTAGIGCTTLDIKRDYDYLVTLWNKIRDATLQSIAPCFIYEGDCIIQKTIRDMHDHNVKELIIQGTSAYKNAIKFMQDILPNKLSILKEYKGKTPIFTKFAVEEQLSNLYQPITTLSSGGYIVINPTEALIAIDVNSGKATSERNIEETALKINLEAAKEIARQIKLRDLSGLIVIDFIDMYDSKNRGIIQRAFKEFLSRDRARIQMANISQFGLLEMSRQRLRSSFSESNSSICSYCSGKGIVRADESNAMLILRTVENEIFNDNINNIVNVFANIASVIYLLNNKRQEISLIEEKYNIKLNFYSDPTATSDNYAIEKIKLPKKLNIHAISKPALQNNSTNYQEAIEDNKETFSKNKQKWRMTETISTHIQPNKNVVVKSEQEGMANLKTTMKQLTTLVEASIDKVVTDDSDNNQIKSTPKRKYIGKKIHSTRMDSKGYNRTAPLDNTPKEKDSDTSN